MAIAMRWLTSHNVIASIALGLFVSFSLSWGMLQFQLRGKAQLFQAEALHLESIVMGALQTSEALALSMQTFYHASTNVNEKHFYAYVGDLTERYSYVSAGLFYQRVDARNRNDYEESLSQRNLQHHRIFAADSNGLKEVSNKTVYFPVTYIFPHTEQTNQYIGLDAFEQPVVKLTQNVRRAIDSGEVRVAEPAQTKGDSTIRLNFYLPVYKNGSVPQDIEQKRSEVQGVVSIAIEPHMTITDADIPAGLKCTLRAGSSNPNSNPLSTFEWNHTKEMAFEMAQALEYKKTKRLAGLPFTFGCEERIGFFSIDHRPLFIIFYIALIASASLYALLRSAIAIISSQSISRTKSEFISTVSHELRTPLTSINGGLSLVVNGVAGEIPEKARNLLLTSSKNCQRLIRLINDILDIEKIESGSLRLEKTPFDMFTAVEQAVNDNKTLADTYKVSFVYSATQDALCVFADTDRIRQVLDNLLSNAAKFSPEGGEVSIKTELHDNRVRVSVIDQGPGIKASFHSEIFSKFTQADASDTREKGGTGLGLSICKSIVEMHDGKIGFDTKEGQGSTFWFELDLVEKTAEQS